MQRVPEIQSSRLPESTAAICFLGMCSRNAFESTGGRARQAVARHARGLVQLVQHALLHVVAPREVAGPEQHAARERARGEQRGGDRVHAGRGLGPGGQRAAVRVRLEVLVVARNAPGKREEGGQKEEEEKEEEMDRPSQQPAIDVT